MGKGSCPMKPIAYVMVMMMEEVVMVPFFGGKNIGRLVDDTIGGK